MDLQMGTFIVEVVSAVIIIFLTFIILKFTARPKVKIRFKNGKKEEEIFIGQEKNLIIHVENQGHCYAKPAARNTVFDVNFDPVFVELIKLEYGTAPPREDTKVKDGKGGKFLSAEGIYLFHEQPGEDFTVTVKGLKQGRCPIEIPARSEEGSCGFQKLWLKVKT